MAHLRLRRCVVGCEESRGLFVQVQFGRRSTSIAARDACPALESVSASALN